MMDGKPVYHTCKPVCAVCKAAEAVTGDAGTLCEACHARELRMFDMARRYTLVAFHAGGDQFTVAAVDCSRETYCPIDLYQGPAAAVELFLTPDLDIWDAQIEMRAREMCRAAGGDPDRLVQDYGRTLSSFPAWEDFRWAAVQQVQAEMDQTERGSR
jgi:hypothetical protein